ncbi:hypothetical protein SSPS47_26685 [Streptomyces sp. S4.7]|nr:hypothetical protein SSPS47_26685 [Streptomyces sp. S4.7]
MFAVDEGAITDKGDGGRQNRGFTGAFERAEDSNEVTFEPHRGREYGPSPRVRGGPRDQRGRPGGFTPGPLPRTWHTIGGSAATGAARTESVRRAGSDRRQPQVRYL